MTIEKAYLKCRDGKKDIEFMFNPKEISFQHTMTISDNEGARSERTGRPKISFSGLPPKVITISNVIFDTYETGEDVVSKYILPFHEATTFIEGKERPPTYSFLWGGSKTYLDYCFVEGVTYKLTKFLADGTPVRAVIDTITLKETESPSEDSSAPKKPQPDRQNDTPQNRSKPEK